MNPVLRCRPIFMARHAANFASSTMSNVSNPLIDTRLTRYLRMLEGFFLRLQMRCDLEDIQRNDAAELDRIIARAA